LAHPDLSDYRKIATSKDDVASLPKSLLHEMLHRMLKIRIFEEHATELHAASRIPGALHTSIGQEAETVGACIALRDDDYMTGNHRSHGHPIGKGAALAPLMAELLGKKTGVCKGKGGSMHLADFSVGSLGESGIVGSGMPIANGAGLSARMRGTDQVCLCFFGDGGANGGSFHESINMAAIWKLPVIFFCENNGYAVTSAQSEMCAVEDIAQRALAYNIPGVILDGQDIVNVYKGVSAAVARARAGEGPSLLEAKTYRFQEHAQFGGLKLPAYRPEAEMQAWLARDPIDIFCRQLREVGYLTDEDLANMRNAITAEVQDAIKFAESSPWPEPEAVFEDLFT
jgi:pyruvate dehydrogenase E1 component alpha subunit